MRTDTITLRELTIRYAPKTDVEGQPVVVGRKLTTPAECGALMVKLLQDQPGEVFAILCLSTKHRVIAYHEVSRGTLDATLVHPREVFKAALLANAAAIVLCHNHPSGDATPSTDDIQLTRRLVEAGALLGVEVLDHIIVGDARYYSIKEALGSRAFPFARYLNPRRPTSLSCVALNSSRAQTRLRAAQMLPTVDAERP